MNPFHRSAKGTVKEYWRGLESLGTPQLLSVHKQELQLGTCSTYRLYSCALSSSNCFLTTAYRPTGKPMCSGVSLLDTLGVYIKTVRLLVTPRSSTKPNLIVALQKCAYVCSTQGLNPDNRPPPLPGTDTNVTPSLPPLVHHPFTTRQRMT